MFSADQETYHENDCHVYVGLSRRESFDQFFVTECYHSFKFNNSAGECPDYDMSTTLQNFLDASKIRIATVTLWRSV